MSSKCRFALVAILGCAVGVLSSLPLAYANTVTYNLVDNPFVAALEAAHCPYQPDTGHVLSGTITTDGATVIQAQDISSIDFAIDGTPYEATNWNESSNAPPWNDSIYVGSDGGLWLAGWFQFAVGGGAGVIEATSSSSWNAGTIFAAYVSNGPTYWDLTFWGIPQVDPLIPVEIATAVPEPTSLSLLVSALLGLAGAFCLRRRRAKA
jgi:hypothetical protein